MKLLVLLTLLAAASVHSRSILETPSLEFAEECGQNEDCRRPRTPDFKIIGHQGSSEIREYANATWAVSFGKSIFGVDVAAGSAAKGLVGYFAGGNNMHEKIRPSVPLITTILRPHHPHHHPHGPGHHNGSHPKPHHPHGPPRRPLVLVGAFVSGKPKSEVPRPDSHHVKLVQTNTSKVYSHSFGGYAISWFVKREIRHLEGDLRAAGEKPCKGKFFVATYDGPLKLFGRRNEVWWTERPHHHHHNHSEDAFPEETPETLVSKDFAQKMSGDFEKPELSGFDQFDSMYLFSEEIETPKEPEGEAPELLQEDEEPAEETPTGKWVSSTGKSIADLINEHIQLSARA